MANENIKLYYFNVRVLAEPIRMIFHYAGVKFEDIRVERESWPELKPKLGWGKMPVVQVGDQEMTQSAAIARYFARQHGLVPSDDLLAYRCDEYVDAANDFRQEWRKYRFEPDEGKKAEYEKSFREVACPLYLSKFNAIVEANGGKDLVGGKETWADFFLVVFLELFEDTVDKDLLKDYPALQNLKRTIHSIPQIKDWIAKRPETLF
jgi:glutathione S-transferase